MKKYSLFLKNKVSFFLYDVNYIKIQKNWKKFFSKFRGTKMKYEKNKLYYREKK